MSNDLYLNNKLMHMLNSEQVTEELAYTLATSTNMSLEDAKLYIALAYRSDTSDGINAFEALLSKLVSTTCDDAT